MITVLYHNDADGFGAAFAVWKMLQGKDEARLAVYTPVQYGQPVPEISEETTWLVIVDFSYDLETLKGLADRFQTLVVDHHKTAEEAVLEFGKYKGCSVSFNLEKSGAMLTWELFHNRRCPEILQYVQDRDLWRFELPVSEEVNLYIEALPREFEAWDKFDLCDAKAAGTVLKAFRAAQINRVVKPSKLREFCGHVVPVVNCAVNISEVGHALLQRHEAAPFSVSYFDSADDKRVYSLRSRGDFDVSDLAKEHGGGGHPQAAGFACSLVGDEGRLIA